MNTKFNICLDVRNEECPIPMIKVGIVCQILEKGEVLKVIANSEGSKKNIISLIESRRLKLVNDESHRNERHFYIKKP